MADYPLFRNNTKYLDNTSDYLARTGKSKQDLVADIERYDGSKGTFLDELKDTPAGGTYENFPTGAWNENPFVRGNALEDIATVPGAANQLQTPATFPVYDYYDEVGGVASSVKSTDLFADSYQDIQNLEGLLKRYVDKVADAPSTVQGSGLTLGNAARPINERGLHMIFPYNTPLPHQSGILQTIQSYADSRGVRFSHELLE